MLVGSLPSQLAVIAGSAANIPGGTSGSGGAGAVRTQNSNYTLTTADNGLTFLANGGVQFTITIPPGLSIGFTFQVVSFNPSPSQAVIVRNQTASGEDLTGTNATGNTVSTSKSGSPYGASFFVKKVTSIGWHVYGITGQVDGIYTS